MQLMMGLLSVERRLVQKRAMHIEELPGQSVVPVGLSSPFKGAVKLEDVLVAFVFSWKWKNDGQSYERQAWLIACYYIKSVTIFLFL